MRWKAQQAEPEHKVGDTRIKTGFLFFPKCLNDEWRWLEKSSWEQKMCLLTAGLCWESTDWGWESTDWADYMDMGA